MNTFRTIMEGALARALDWNVTVPSAKSVMWARISNRQQELFSFAAQVDPEYYEVEAIGTLDDGAIDLDAMLEDGVLEVVKATRAKVEELIADPVSETPPAVGDDIKLIPASDDPDAYAPSLRATIKNKVFKQVGTDLADVLTIHLFYSYRPNATAVDENGLTEVSIEAPFDALLEIDLARDLARKTVGMDPVAKAAIITGLDDEEKGMLLTFADHIRSFSAGRESRMGHTSGSLTG